MKMDRRRRTRHDEGHELTEQELSDLERRIASVYKGAADDLQGTINAYFDSFSNRDAETKALVGTVVNGMEYTEQDYQQWRLAQIGRGKRFEALQDKVARRYTKANETAVAYTNDATPGIYSLNRNYAAYTIEQVAGNVGFDLWDEQTVKRLIVEQPDLMPYYPKKRAVQRGIDLAWGKKQITASVTSSILQGKSIKHMADDLQSRISTMNRDSAIRTARTAVTGAQNAGRMDSYAAAQKMGIELEREWLATLDGRTRHEHAMMDGQKAPIDRPFVMDGYKIMYPGDMSAPGYLVYNCRCTLVAAVKGADTSDAKRRARDPETGDTVLIENMSYAEWSSWKRSIGMSTGGEISNPGIPVQVGTVDFADKKSVIAQLQKAKAELSSLSYEVNYSVTSDGKVWRTSGDSGTVNPSGIPSSLKGSFSYHNHPKEKTNYSFSAEDTAFFISSGEAYSEASDDVYEYTMRRTPETIEMQADEVYHRFKEIYNKDILELSFSGLLDIDYDGYHETMIRLSKELKFDYDRKKKGEYSSP